MREFQDALLNDPDLVFDSKPFTVRVPSSRRAYEFTHNQPVHVQTLLPFNAQDKKDEFSPALEAIIKWISGGPNGDLCRETAIYGVVQLKMEDFSAQIADFSVFAAASDEAEKKAQKEYEKARKDFMSKSKAALEIAQQMADRKVREALKITHHNITKQWDTLKQDGKGHYSPSIAEAVGAHILQAEIDKASKQKTEMVQRFMKTAEQSIIM